jgi:hypothetical protein
VRGTPFQSPDNPVEPEHQVGCLGQMHGLYLPCSISGQACQALIDILVQPGVLPDTVGPSPPSNVSLEHEFWLAIIQDDAAFVH